MLIGAVSEAACKHVLEETCCVELSPGSSFSQQPRSRDIFDQHELFEASYAGADTDVLDNSASSSGLWFEPFGAGLVGTVPGGPSADLEHFEFLSDWKARFEGLLVEQKRV